MKKTFLKQIKDILICQKQSLMKQSEKDADIDTDGDEIDEIQANLLIQMNNKLNIRNSAKLAQIDSALKRLEDKTYGICEDCEENIPEKRLLLNPYFQTCVSCAEEREAEDKQRKRF